MPERTYIPLIPQGSSLNPAVLPMPTQAGAFSARVQDRLMRPLQDLRISVTDRCNFRCGYCMPKEIFGKDHPYLPHSALLSFEEITRVARLFAGLGVRKLRLTGGEPLLRKNLDSLVKMLSDLRTCADGQPLDLTLTTNGALLSRMARRLKDSGLNRITVSLDAIDDQVFRQMNDVDFPVADVLEGIEAAVRAGLGPVKVNVVVKRGVNEHQVLPLARYFRAHYGKEVCLRFIEYMDVGATNGWRMDDVVPSTDLLAKLTKQFPLEPVPAASAGETAQRWRYQDGQGEVGFISSVTQAFCRECTRARLSTEGKIYLCLFAGQGYDLRSLLRGSTTEGTPYSDESIQSSIAALWSHREDRYSELRQAHSPGSRQRIEMSYIGG